METRVRGAARRRGLRLSQKEVVEEAKARYHDWQSNPGRTAARRPAARSRPVRRVVAKASTARRAPVSVGQLKTSAMLCPHIVDSMPACSRGPAGATAAYGRGKLSVRVTPGQALVFIATPGVGCGGYLALSQPGLGVIPFLNNENSQLAMAIANGYTPGPVPTNPGVRGTGLNAFIGEGCLGNVSAVTVVNQSKANAATFTYVPFTNDPINIPGYDIATVIEENPLYTVYPNTASLDTPVAGLAIHDPYKGQQSYYQSESSSYQFEVACDWQAACDVYNVGTNSAPLGLGPQTGLTANNDDDAYDSTVWAQNPLVNGFSSGAVSLGNAPYTDILSGLTTMVAPITQTGGGDMATQFYEMQTVSYSNNFLRAGSSKFPPLTSGYYPWEPIQSQITPPPDGYHATLSYPGDAINPTTVPAAYCPPLCWGGEGDRFTAFTNDYGAGQQFEGDNLHQLSNNMASGFVMSPDNIARAAEGVFGIVNRSSGGTVLVNITFMVRYNLVSPINSNTIGSNVPTLPFVLDHVRQVGGYAGNGANKHVARADAVRNLVNAADQRGFPLPPFVRRALSVGMHIAPALGLFSGISPTTMPGAIAEVIESASSPVTQPAAAVKALGVHEPEKKSGINFDSIVSTIEKGVNIGKTVWPVVAPLVTDLLAAL